MPDQRSVMKEFRFLDQKRLAEGLTADEQARYSELHDLIGPEMGAGGLRGGFDVGAAAARLRESLLPAGLRNRPVVAEAEAEPLEPEPVEEELAAAPAYPAAEPPAREPEREPEPEPPFDPAILAALPA
ncbi:MAG TPA: chemotaxis protein CheA, partial [Anaeromyxobacter sp.]|nr:chemotaxis protein CheA [Anaeromyxobacter sp.]